MLTFCPQTEKSMAELELALNKSYKEWSGSEDGISITGAGLTGLANMGNSCYLNSVVQILFIIPDFIKKSVFINLIKYCPISRFNFCSEHLT